MVAPTAGGVWACGRVGVRAGVRLNAHTQRGAATTPFTVQYTCMFPFGCRHRREAAYRAAGALENLAADNDENAASIVEAGVVPAMKELLVGKGNVDLSQKA